MRPARAAREGAPRVRVFTACHPTPFMVVQHLRRNLDLPAAREFLMWYPEGPSRLIDDFLSAVVLEAGFEGTLDMRDFALRRPRTSGPLGWSFEAARRYRLDSNRVRNWVRRNGMATDNLELWIDEPIHFNGFFPKALFHRSRHVKLPHCFNLDDEESPDYRRWVLERWQDPHWAKRRLFWPWLKWTSDVDLGARNMSRFDQAYSFDRPSPWAEESIDVSHLVSIQAFRATYDSLPNPIKKSVEAMLEPILDGRRPLVLLLLFGLDPELRHRYEEALMRLFVERGDAWRGCTLVVKFHPGAVGQEEEALIAWIEKHLPVAMMPLRSVLNLEFLLPMMRPDYVLAGPCGALPTVARLGMGMTVALEEIAELLSRRAGKGPK